MAQNEKEARPFGPVFQGKTDEPLFLSGEGGIRTPDTASRVLVFETSAFNRSATSPEEPIIRRVAWSVEWLVPASRANALLSRNDAGMAQGLRLEGDENHLSDHGIP